MKKIFAILLAAVMVILLVSCNNSNGGEATPTPAQDETVVATPTPEAEGNADVTPTAEPTPKPTPKPLELLATAKLNELNEYKVRLIETESGKGKLEYIYANTAPEEDLKEAGFTQSLTLVQTIIYDVTINKNGNTFEVSGTPSGVKMEIVGAEKDKYMQMMQQMVDEEFKRAVGGETLTGDDLEKLLYEIDGTCAATFTVGETVDVKLTRKFIQWGSRENVEEVTEIVNGKFNSFNRFENGELVQDGLNAEE